MTCDGTDVEIGLRCPDYAERVLDAATVVLAAARNELALADESLRAVTRLEDSTPPHTPATDGAGPHGGDPVTETGPVSSARYRAAVAAVLAAEQVWIASAAQYAATGRGSREMVTRTRQVEQAAQDAWMRGDRATARQMFEDAALHEQSLTRGDVLRFAARETFRRLGSAGPRRHHDCGQPVTVLPDSPIPVNVATVLLHVKTADD